MPEPPNAALRDLGLQTGDHVCGFYWGVDGRDEIMLPFLLSGLEAGDSCICVVHATEPSAVFESLGAKTDVQAHVAAHHLDVRPASETYLRGGHFSVTEMIEFYEDFVRTATVSGGVARVAGEGAWALEGHPGAEHLMDYESELNRLVKRHPQIILCLYDLAFFGGTMMVDLLRTHPRILLGGMLIENPYCLTPDEFLATRTDGGRPAA
jgi:MEDS: MEthanogen/methylotroph, DcmR Sensory domain